MNEMTSAAFPDPLDWRHDHYVGLRTALLGAPSIDLRRMHDWPSFWNTIFLALAYAGYARSTCKLYRQVLRSLRGFGLGRPCDITPEVVQRFVQSKANAHASAHSLAMTISVLRTVFEALCGETVTTLTATPKRPDHLPTILGTGEVVLLLQAGRSVRDQLLLGLLYGCALRPGELRALTWDDVAADGAHLWVDESAHGPGRRLRVPDVLAPVLREGKQVCREDEPVFPGRRATGPISKRALELIVRHAARDAGIIKPVTPVRPRRHPYSRSNGNIENDYHDSKRAGGRARTFHQTHTAGRSGDLSDGAVYGSTVRQARRLQEAHTRAGYRGALSFSREKPMFTS